MKPKEFDDLVRQKFEQNDFAYNPRHWDMLTERMDGKEKKRRIMMWWWAPLAGMAASVALAMGVSTMLRMNEPMSSGEKMAAGRGAATQQHIAERGTTVYRHELAQNVVPGQGIPAQDELATPSSRKKIRNTDRNNKRSTPLNTRVAMSNSEESDNRGFRIRLQNVPGKQTDLNAKPEQLRKNEEEKTKKLAVNEPIGTFIAEEEPQVKKPKRISVILSGGYNSGNRNTGYMAGATIRKMLNDKVYIEGQVAFAASNNIQSTSYAVQEVLSAPTMGTAARMSSRVTKDVNKTTVAPVTREVIKQKDISYDLYYAQVSPSIGYNVMKKMSVGIGPDFQQMLADNRPAPSSSERGTIQVAPMFDVGFIGKTELSVTKKLKAGIYYRKSVNNVITPMGKYIDRDYLQFQVKYTILNK